MRGWIIVLLAGTCAGCVGAVPEAEPEEDLGTATQDCFAAGPSPHGVVADEETPGVLERELSVFVGRVPRW